MRIVSDVQALEHVSEVQNSLEELRTRLSADAQRDGDAEVLRRASELIAKLQELTSTLDGQLATMRYLAQQRFRPKTEKVAPGQLALDLLGFLMQQQADAAPALDDNQGASLPDPPKKPPREKRKGAVRLLPVEAVECTLPEAERICDCCGNVKAPMGFETSRHLIYDPARLFFREEHLFKYACRGCQDGVVTAAGTPKLIEGSNASSSVLAHLVVSKVIDTTPIERVGKQFARHGADIASSTLHDWFGRCGKEASVLQPVARRQLLASGLISFDDSPMLAMRSDGHSGTTKGRLWLYVGDIERVAYCEFTPDWKGKHPMRVLADFRGPIQSDGYGGALALFRGRDAPTQVGCNDHARRKFVDALKRGDKRVEPVIALYGGLYAVEREAHSMTPQQRLVLRQLKSAPLWQRLQAEVERLALLRDGKGPLGKAVTYFERQGPHLAAFLRDGHLPISNAHVERLLRIVALFRKNSLFVGSVEAGERYAALMTLALNCVLRGDNPYAYFVSLFDRLAAGWPQSLIDDLLPQLRLGPEQPLKQP
jgi:transposase